MIDLEVTRRDGDVSTFGTQRIEVAANLSVYDFDGGDLRRWLSEIERHPELATVAAEMRAALDGGVVHQATRSVFMSPLVAAEDMPRMVLRVMGDAVADVLTKVMETWGNDD